MRRCVVVMSRWRRWLLGGNDDDCVERHTKSTPNCEKNDIKEEEEEIPLLYDAIGKGKKTTSRKKSVAALAMMSFAMALALLAFCGAVGRRETTVGLESRLGARMYMVFWGRDGFDYDDAAVLASNRAPLGNSTTTTTKSESTNNNTDTNATEEE